MYPMKELGVDWILTLAANNENSMYLNSLKARKYTN